MNGDETSRQVLIVDDQPEVRLGVRVMLESDGYEIIEARDGEEALEILATTRPNLIILDVVMPRLDGWETLRRAQADPQLVDIPVLMLTALDQPRHIQTGINLGCTWYYTKPITNFDDFALIVRRIIDSTAPPPE